MRWHERVLNINGMPDSDSVIVVGLVEEMIVKVNVEYFKGDKQYSITEWSKPLNMWHHTELINEEVEDKYLGKLLKISSRHENKKFADWLQYFSSMLDTSSRHELGIAGTNEDHDL